MKNSLRNHKDNKNEADPGNGRARSAVISHRESGFRREI